MRTASGTRLYDARHRHREPCPAAPGTHAPRPALLHGLLDGMDGGAPSRSGFDAFQRLEHAPAVFTVGVGSGASSRLQDLERIAFKAGSRDRSEEPRSAVLVEASKTPMKPSVAAPHRGRAAGLAPAGGQPRRHGAARAHPGRGPFPVDLAIQSSRRPHGRPMKTTARPPAAGGCRGRPGTPLVDAGRGRWPAPPCHRRRHRRERPEA